MLPESYPQPVHLTVDNFVDNLSAWTQHQPQNAGLWSHFRAPTDTRPASSRFLLRSVKQRPTCTSVWRVLSL